MAQPAAQQQPSSARTAGTAAAVGAGAVVATTGLPVPSAAGLTAMGVATAGILAGFVSFLASLRERHRVWLTQELSKRATVRNDVAEVVRQEMLLEDAFARKAADRLAGKLPQALRIVDPAERERTLRQLFSNEERIAGQRAEAMVARALAALTRLDLRRSSPQGAFWRLGVAQNHTPGCLFMAEKFWPWAVLDRVHPPRHYGCTSTLHGLSEAVSNGWMGPDDVPDTRQAVRAAAGVVMEQQHADALLAELDVRDRLLEVGVDTSLIPFAGVAEAFDEGKHPRGYHGRFRGTFHGPAWLSRSVVRDLMAGRVTATSLGALHREGGDPFFGRVADEMGFAGKPRVVGKAELDRLVAGGATEVVRGVAPGPQGPGQYAEAFRKGELWPGHGVWGSGTYTYAVDSRGGKAWLEGQLASAGARPEGVMRIAIPKDARVITYGDAYRGLHADRAELDRMIAAGEGDVEALQRVRDAITTNIGRWAALNGYQAIHVSEEDIYIVLDRSAVVVQRPGAESVAELAAAALKRGERAHVTPEHAPALIDALADGSKSSLHLLEVSGHPNLFRAHARELSRAEMPQIPKEHLPGFMDFLRSKRVGATVDEVAPSSLQATQNQINGGAVAALAKGWDPQKGGIMLISRDGHVLDGHHRWAAAALHEMTHPGYKVNALRFSAGTDRILALMREYNELVGVRVRKFGEGRVPGMAA